MAHSIQTALRPSVRSGLPSLRLMLAAYRQRRALARLDAARLADIGLSAREARLEAQRPLWDVPHHWLG